MIDHVNCHSSSSSSEGLQGNDLRPARSVDSGSSDAHNAEKVDRGEVAWAQFTSGNKQDLNQLFVAAQAGVFKARLGLMHEYCKPAASSSKPHENDLLNAVLWGKKAINAFQSMNKAKQILAISEPDSTPDQQDLKTIFVDNLEVADTQTEINHQLGTRFANFNKQLPEQQIQQQVDKLDTKFRALALDEQEWNSAFNEMQYLSNVCIAQNMPDKAVSIYSQLLPLLPEYTPPWQELPN